jgi:2-C-methyl-D-erythritol 4-phosphate cytidylyltransferase
MFRGKKVGAVIVAAGESRRMGGIDKMWAELAGKPVIAHTINVFQSCDFVDQIVTVFHRTKLEDGQKLIAQTCSGKPVQTCPGGERRQDSVASGLSQFHACDWIIIHDGARPLVTVETIEKGLKAAAETGAAIAAMPVKDTIKNVSEGMFVSQTLSRKELWGVQTPQVFRYDIITEAYRRIHDDVTDDAMMVERMGIAVKVFQGSYDNIKITTPEDVAIAECLLSYRSRVEG